MSLWVRESVSPKSHVQSPAVVLPKLGDEHQANNPNGQVDVLSNIHGNLSDFILKI